MRLLIQISPTIRRDTAEVYTFMLKQLLQSAAVKFPEMLHLLPTAALEEVREVVSTAGVTVSLQSRMVGKSLTMLQNQWKAIQAGAAEFI